MRRTLMLLTFRFKSAVLMWHNSWVRIPVSTSSKVMAWSRSAIGRTLAVCGRLFQLVNPKAGRLGSAKVLVQKQLAVL